MLCREMNSNSISSAIQEQQQGVRVGKRDLQGSQAMGVLA